MIEVIKEAGTLGLLHTFDDCFILPRILEIAI